MAIEIEILESKKEIISGIPEFVVVTPVEGVIFYYSLDGQEPDLESLLADGNIEMPTDGRSVMLRIVGFSIDEDVGGLVPTTELFGKDYYPSPYYTSASRHSHVDGVVVSPYGGDAVNSLSVLFDGSPAQESSIKFSDLEVKASTHSRSGGKIPNDSTVSFVRRSISNDIVQNDRINSSVNDINFNPKANVIEIDGRTEERKNSQVVRVVNRSYNSIEPASNFYDENWKRNEQVITGNLVRTVYNRDTGVIVFYYWDSKESRWLISRQNIGSSGPYDISGYAKQGRGNRFVYRWIQERAFTRIF